MSSDWAKSFGADRWNACIKIFARPIEELDDVQPPASLAFRYEGRVMNGGHSLHFDFRQKESNDELLDALKRIGAHQHARILAEAFFLRSNADRASEEERDHTSELIEDLDLAFCRLVPEMSEVIAKYIDAHPDNFPK